MVLFATTKFDNAREPVGSTMQARYVKLTLPCTTIGPVGDGDALDEDEVEEATTDDEPVAELPELVAAEEPEEETAEEPELVAAEEPEEEAIEDEIAEVLEFDTDDEDTMIELPELVAAEDPEVAVIDAERVDEPALEVAVEFAINTFVAGGLNLYIWRRLPAPQYSVVLPGQSMLQSAWLATNALPAFGLDPQ